jgi:hypothetical protein
MPDAIALLKEHRPPVTHAPDLEALERILAAPAPARRRRSTRPRRALVVAGAAAVIAVAATPLLDDSPDVVARAAAALDAPDSILHFKATWGESGGPAHGSVETWRADGGRMERTLWAGGESAEDWNSHTGAYYDRPRNQIRRVTQEAFDRAHELPDGVAKLESVSISPWFTSADDFAALLEEARHGDANVHELPDTTVRGVPVHQLKIAVDVPQASPRVVSGDPSTAPAPASPMHAERIVSIDRETYLPVRIEVRLGRGPAFTTDYSDVEQLPRTEANEALLRMAPHPGAKEVVAGG